ncbi:ABC transporter permease [Sessilibacter corallicola]|uniref:Transport permease protein n=1 Tax=Sessilibacter corallicola TaxID=2904075 RepID=A0ABQ0A693_9GAMM
MKRILSLFLARNKEYYRDRASLIWSFVMPPLIIAVVALAFSRGEQPLFRLGVLGETTAEISQKIDQKGVQVIRYDDQEEALQKIKYHQIDLLIQPSTEQFWVNPISQKSDFVKTLFIDHASFESGTSNWQENTVSGNKVRYVDWAIPGIIGMNLMFSSLFGIGYVIVRYRKNGVLKRLQASPVRPIEFLTAQILSRLIIMIIVSAIVFMVANFILDFVMLGSYFNLFLVAVLGMLSLLSLGLIVASRLANEEFANGLLNFFAFPMMLLSEVWFSLDGAPQWMSTISSCLPLTHMVQSARAIMLDGAGLADISHHLLVLGLMTTVFMIIATSIFRWRES